MNTVQSPAQHELLLRGVGAEHDTEGATTVVLRIMERIEDAERAEWVNFLGGGKRDRAYRRAYELSILRHIVSGAFDAADVARELDGWSSWLQLRIAGSAPGTAILDVVGELGRTRRIRHTAKGRRAFIAGRR